MIIIDHTIFSYCEVFKSGPAAVVFVFQVGKAVILGRSSDMELF